MLTPTSCKHCNCGACPGFYEPCTCPTPKGWAFTRIHDPNHYPEAD